MARSVAKLTLDTKGARSYQLDVVFDGNAGLVPSVTGLTLSFPCQNDHARVSLIKILEQAVTELHNIGNAGR